MGKVIDIDAYEPHLTGELICLRCGYRYVGTWNEKVWLKQLYCPNCQIQGFTIGTGQIMESYLNEKPGCDKEHPHPQSKPGQIIDFPLEKLKQDGQNVNDVIEFNQENMKKEVSTDVERTNNSL